MNLVTISTFDIQLKVEWHMVTPPATWEGPVWKSEDLPPVSTATRIGSWVGIRTNPLRLTTRSHGVGTYIHLLITKTCLRVDGLSSRSSMFICSGTEPRASTVAHENTGTKFLSFTTQVQAIILCLTIQLGLHTGTRGVLHSEVSTILLMT
jgi:hypothetical protein